MNTTIGAYEAKSKLPELLARAAAGEVITITQHDRPMAKLVPAVRASDSNLQALFEQTDVIRDPSKLHPAH